jgi:lipoprotein-anchoring transpeptidase ErfK/SrfK
MMTKQNLLKLAAILTISGADAFAEEKRIVISIPDRKLLLLEGSRIVKIYDVAVGAPATPTPAGEFQIVNRVPHPTYFGHGKIVAPGAANPLGSRWMGLSAKGYGIHGTNVPASIGHAASHGCIRMRKQDLEELFERVEVGVPVELHQERPAVYTAALATILAIAVTE